MSACNIVNNYIPTTISLSRLPKLTNKERMDYIEFYRLLVLVQTMPQSGHVHQYILSLGIRNGFNETPIVTHRHQIKLDPVFALR